MALCHECGSEVAGNDQFCPYCGIALQIDGEPPDDAAFESTIIMQPPPVQVSQKEAASSPAPAETKEPASSLDDFNDVPTPIALQELERSAEDSIGPPENFEHIPSPAKPIESAPAQDSSSSSSGEGQGANLKADSEPDTLDQVFLSESSVETGIAPESSLDNDPPEVLIPSEAVTIEEEEVPGIAKPADLPVSEEPRQTPSMFDSVRIMDKGEGENMPFGAGIPRNEPSNVPTPSLTGTTEPAVVNRAQTSSKIGLVDTDGRKGIKLKPLEEGTILNGRYEIVRKIGGGGMGAVYLASDNNLGGVLRAVKEMVQAHIEEEQQEKAINDFKRESMILSTLDHPSIPTIYDYFFDEKECRFYLVMKYISGGDLASRLRAAPEGKIDEKTVTEWGIQVADVLDYLHNQPSTIVYRDLKPSNIMIDGNTGRVMLIDFGIARSINQKEEKGVTAVGTMGYAPPELFSGNVEPRSDIYSLGSTMFHLLTGADPQSNPLLIFDFQKNPRPRQICPQLSDQIERILMRTVEYNAGSRFNSAAELRQVLDDHLQNLKRGNVTYGVKEIPASVSLANQNVFCGFCGQKIVATDLFCAFCGSKQPIAQHGVHSEIYSARAMTAKLLVIGTSELDSPMFKLEKQENLIGRRDPMSNIFPEVDLSKFDPQTKISRRHAKIWREGATYLVEDLGSSNGTMLLSNISDSLRLLPHQPRQLSSGDKIKLGDTILHFVLG